MSEEAQIVREVAAAVGLAEGEAGVRDVLRAVARREPVAVRKVSRATELPVPIVSAICNELRKRGVVDRQRPVRLTPLGRGLAGAGPCVDATCPTCAGRELVVPPSFEAVARELSSIAARAPRVRVEIDQSHCSVETKLRRVLALVEAGAVDGRRILLLGDDDLVSVALTLAAGELGLASSIRGLVVLDLDPAVISFVRGALRRAPFEVEALVHDLRDPLPERLRGAADTVVTDPPYTADGATLFLSRAAEATAGPPGRDVFLAFGPKRPDELLRVQRAIAAMGFTVRRLVRNFHDYLGAGVLAGTSHLYHLVTTTELQPLVDGRYDGRLYTGDFRDPVRAYRCVGCRAVQRVGRGRAWPTVEALERARCPRCGADRFRPVAGVSRSRSTRA
jgi:predicted methyltransferase/DNA-directed RNA polymerase subunit RPC12/RpoP